MHVPDELATSVALQFLVNLPRPAPVTTQTAAIRLLVHHYKLRDFFAWLVCKVSLPCRKADTNLLRTRLTSNLLHDGL